MGLFLVATTLFSVAVVLLKRQPLGKFLPQTLVQPLHIEAAAPVNFRRFGLGVDARFAAHLINHLLKRDDLRAFELIGYDTPEPGGMMLVAIGGMAALGRRRPKKCLS